MNHSSMTNVSAYSNWLDALHLNGDKNDALKFSKYSEYDDWVNTSLTFLMNTLPDDFFDTISNAVYSKSTLSCERDHFSCKTPIFIPYEGCGGIIKLFNLYTKKAGINTFARITVLKVLNDIILITLIKLSSSSYNYYKCPEMFKLYTKTSMIQDMILLYSSLSEFSLLPMCIIMIQSTVLTVNQWYDEHRIGLNIDRSNQRNLVNYIMLDVWDVFNMRSGTNLYGSNFRQSSLNLIYNYQPVELDYKFIRVDKERWCHVKECIAKELMEQIDCDRPIQFLVNKKWRKSLELTRNRITKIERKGGGYESILYFEYNFLPLTYAICPSTVEFELIDGLVDDNYEIETTVTVKSAIDIVTRVNTNEMCTWIPDMTDEQAGKHYDWMESRGTAPKMNKKLYIELNMNW